MRARLWALSALAVFLCVPSGLQAQFRPISDAERSAVTVAAGYLARGPQAVIEKLASTSPLKALSPGDAAAEIAVRLGPPAGATWELQTVVPALKDKKAAFTIAFPSGVDDNVFFDMAKEGDDYRVANIRTLAEPTDVTPPFAQAAVAPAEHPTVPTKIALYASLSLAILGVILIRAQAVAGRIALLVAVVAGCGSVGYGLWMEKLIRPIAPVVVQKGPPLRRLGELVPLREAMAAGKNDVGPAFAKTARGDGAAVAALWKAQSDLEQMRLDAVTRATAAFPLPSNIPLVGLLRARVAMLKNDPASAVVAYQSAINAGPGRDALSLEMAQALEVAEFPERAQAVFRRLVEMGSRDPAVYYTIAAAAASDAHFSKSEAALKEAWQLQPTERRNLVGTDVLWEMLRRKDDQLVNLSLPQESNFVSPARSTRAIALPAGATAMISGELLEIAVGDQKLVVHGGCALAPADATVVDAGAWARLSQERALRDVPALTEAASASGALTQPALRRRISQAAAALIERNRWADLVKLTDALRGDTPFVTSDLIIERARALDRMGRTTDAKQLLADYVVSPAVKHSTDPRKFEEAGDMLAAFGLHDAATKMFEKAEGVRKSAYDDLRVAQISLYKQLESQYATYTSPHFEIRYPPDVFEKLTAMMMAKVLEGELARLQRFVPVANFRPIKVNIVPFNKFMLVNPGGNDVVAFYQADAITAPFAGMGADLDPAITAVITHELCHAMVAQATNEQAPHWFQEGLAQRVEMKPYSDNAFNAYDDSKFFALAVLDPVLTDAHDDGMVQAAYMVSQTFIRYLESRYGADAPKKLIASFANGATTDEAIRALTGKPAVDVDAEFRIWGHAEKRFFENPAPIIYKMTMEEQLGRTAVIPTATPTPAPTPAPRQTLRGGTLHPMNVRPQP